MLDQLLGLIQDNSHEAIVQNPVIPNEQNNEVMQTLLGSITGGLQDHAQTGNLPEVMGLLSGKSTSTSSLMTNPIVSSIAQSAISAIMRKFGLDQTSAGGIVSSVLPGVLGGLISKVSNPNDSSISFNDVLGGGSNQATTQSSGFDFNQIGNAMADGKLDMNDLIRIGGNMMGGHPSAASSNPAQPDGMDLGGLLGGLFGKK